MRIENTPYEMLTEQERALTKAELDIVKWPDFMQRDAVEVQYWPNLIKDFAEYQFGIFETGDLVGIANTIPLSMDLDEPDYNDSGWDWAIKKGFSDKKAGLTPNVLCGLQIAIGDEHKGKGLSLHFIECMKVIARRNDLTAVILPIRPTLKHQYPLISMEDYVSWQNDDGQPFDPWIRTHVKAGGEIIKVCRRAMYITGTLEDWRQWTGLAFKTSGRYIVEGALVPVSADVYQNWAEYVEPNLWVRHEL